MSAPDAGPLAGLSVVEVAAGTSDLGLGAAGGVPGMILADLGARVVRVVDAAAPIDAHVPWGRAWHRAKDVVVTGDRDETFALLRDADAALVYGPEALVEGRGLGYRDLREANPSLVHARCRPGRTSKGTVEDFGLLVEANAGFCTQLEGHRPGPIFVDARASGVGTACLLTVQVLALLTRRGRTGAGGWAETSLYDGMLATLGCMIGRSERAAAEIEGYWRDGSTFPNFLYRCADGELLQVWFGGKGMYRSLIEVLGDEPSDDGYYTDQMTGRLGERAARWVSFFATRPRAEWTRLLRAAGVACEPVLGPGEALADPHLAETGLARTLAGDGHRDVVVGSPIAVSRLGADRPAGDGRARRAARARDGDALAGLRVVDFSAFVAGPLAAEILADLGADVIKVEPPGGEAMRAAAYAVAACQRGKRSLALDVGAPEARPVVERLLRGADVVLHNFRVGVSERLGIDEATVAALNPHAVYCHATAFGDTGPRASLPGNDALMQAVTGFERAIGGDGNDPIAATWIPIDMCGGWVAAAGVLAGLYARTTGGGGRRVVTSLLGSGMLVHSGVFERDGALVRGPEVDARQTGYGPGHRLYEGGDGRWFALVLPDERAWARLAALPEIAGLPAEYAPLRGGAGDAAARRAERVLEAAFATADAAAWVARLRGLGLAAEPVEPLDRDAFRRAVLDDPVNRDLGRVVQYDTADWGRFEQIGPLVRYGPEPVRGPRLMLPGIGEHTVEVLTELGFGGAEVDALLAAEVARRLDAGAMAIDRP
ncbi:CoA transferase [Actinomadura algeriensis]|uniref:Crotonobetainyl-CoA:carnitine CoA-transferase CaiB-like acyl-CoA transferase n=1 Tax=Actinomadura algeriensis TaxID=1679523 RepID=A0ABR9K3C8_9ACTN|nr:CoA transferase [Actinomadura algeriensis]MBE1537104.1 crotonobetainyl-CoA:carnitine CoA-transferase CaiB-like acyl-CoA transferase [Actinomadura algeriensis]